MKKAKSPYKIVPQKLVIIGCGNLAWHLCSVFSKQKGLKVIVVNHKANKALNEIKARFSCDVFSSLSALPPDANFYFICVPDKHIKDVSKKIEISNASAIVAHTSGCMGLNVFTNLVQEVAVFYPLQTFSKSDEVSWEGLPVLIESHNTGTSEILRKLAMQVGAKAEFVNNETRARIHLAAVLVNNFTNSLYVAAEELLQKGNKKISFDLLLPLIKNTGDKVAHMNPKSAQTGPAKRNDNKVIRKHVDLIGKDKSLVKIYKLLTELIQKQQHV